MGIIAKWKSRMFAKTVPAIIVHDEINIEVHDGLVRGTNTLTDPWTERGYEIKTDPVRITRNGKTETGFVCVPYGATAGLTVDLKSSATGIDKGTVLIRWDGIIGKLLSADVIEKGTSLAASMKDKIIFLVVGMLLGWTVLSPIMGQILK